MKTRLWIPLLCTLLILSMLPMVASATTVNGYDFDNRQNYYLTFGTFAQSADGEEAPILWRVLASEDDQVYLLSEYILFNGCVHSDYPEFDTTLELDFRNSELYAYLNGEFMDIAFTADEQTILITDEELGTVTMPSISDIKSEDYGLFTDTLRKGYGTEYALENGLFQYGNGSSPYWTRDASSAQSGSMRCTKVDGNTGYIRCEVVNLGCRPVIRLDLSTVDISGDGSIDNPYVILLAEGDDSE